MSILAQNTYSIKRVAKENYRLDLFPETIALPANASGVVTDYSTAKTALKLSYNSKEIYPTYNASLDGEIGGRNLLRNTSSSAQYVTIVNNTGYYFFSGKTDLSTLSLSVGDWVTLSFLVYDIQSGYNPRAAFLLSINNVDSYYIAPEYYPNKNSFSIQIPAGTTKIATYVALAVPAYGDVNFGYKGLKLEKGNKATDWTPAPADLESQINSALIRNNCSASIYNGILEVVNLTADAGYVDIPLDYGVFKQTKRLTLAKSKQGSVGSDGKSITLVDVEYGVSANSAVLPSTWATTAPTLTGSQQLWTRTKTTYSAGSPTYTTPANITPRSGADGAAGTGIESITEEYYLSSSKTTQTGGSWVTNPPVWKNGWYIWTRSKIVYKNPTSTVYVGVSVSSSWEAVNEIKIGGNNLVEGSYINIQSNLYGFGSCTVEVVAGEQYVFSACAKINSQAIADGKYCLMFINSSDWSWTKSLIFDESNFKQKYIIFTANKTERLNIASFYYPDGGSRAGLAHALWYQVQEGNMPTAYKFPLSVELHNKAIADKFSTTDGGMWSSVILELHEPQPNEFAPMPPTTAGISGMQGNNKELPAVWTGGTLDDALNGNAGAVLRHDGSGEFAKGMIRWDKNGEMAMGKYFTDKTILIAPNKTIPTMAEILNKEQYWLVDYNNSIWVDLNNPSEAPFTRTIEHTSEFELTNRAFLSSFNVYAAIETPYSSAIIDDVELLISLQKKNANGSWSVISQLTEDDFVSDVGIPYAVNMIFDGGVLENGVYRIIKKNRFVAHAIGYPAYVNIVVRADIQIQYFIKKLVIGSDGISFSDSMSDSFFRLSLQDSIPLRYRGAIDIPGNLLSGSVGLNGGFNQVWGVKKHASSTAIRNSVGYYTVYHSIGHNNYTVLITPETDGRICYVYSKNIGSFNVYFKNLSGALSDSNFSFLISGMN